MYAPKCHDHRSLVFDFALGRLDDRDAMRAEHALDTCEVCKTWWAENFACDEIPLVDNAVKVVFDSVKLPQGRTYRHAWAAAAVLMIGILALWQTLPGFDVQQTGVHAENEIWGMDFEGHEAAPQLDSDLAADAIVRLDFESAVVIASATAGTVILEPSGTSGEKLAGFDFESGSLVGVTPQT